MSEQSEAKRDGATLQPNSGRGKFKKGDAVLEPFLIDYKEYAKSFSVSIENWAKHSKDAIIRGRLQPAFKIVLGGKLRLWIISDDMFHEMHRAWTEKQGENNE
jgi:hypothetical protein